MLNYLSAELWRMARRRLDLIWCAAYLLLVGVVALSWTGASLHQTMEGFRDFLVIGLYLGYPLAALADGEARRLGTLRNEVSYGLPWGRIYLGKLCSALLAGTVLFLLTAAVFFAVGFPLSEHRQIQPDRLLLAWAGLLTGTLSAFPRYIGAVGLAHLLCFSLRSSGLLWISHLRGAVSECSTNPRPGAFGAADQLGGGGGAALPPHKQLFHLRH